MDFSSYNATVPCNVESSKSHLLTLIKAGAQVVFMPGWTASTSICPDRTSYGGNAVLRQRRWALRAEDPVSNLLRL